MKVTLSSRYLRAGEYDVRVVGTYHDGTPAIEIYHDGEYYGRVTVCLTEPDDPDPDPPSPDHCWIKDWSENEGVYATLVAAGVVHRSKFSTTVGPYRCRAYYCRMSSTLIEEWRTAREQRNQRTRRPKHVEQR